MRKSQNQKASRTKKTVAKPKAPVNHRDQPVPSWKSHLGCYRYLTSLTFGSQAEVDKAIDLLWTDELYELPHDFADGDTLIIPTEALDYFTRAGLKFSAKNVRFASEFPPEYIDQLRREQGFS